MDSNTETKEQNMKKINILTRLSDDDNELSIDSSASDIRVDKTNS